MRRALIGIALLGLTLTTAEAAPHHKASHRNHYTHVSSHHHAPRHRAHRRMHHKRSISDYRAGPTNVKAEYLPHPPGCPPIQFCGCGAAYEAYGHVKRFVNGLNLFLAREWKHLPHASPGPGMAAASNTHVFILKQHISGNVWLVADHNSGHHQSRLHARSIAGFTIVNPHG